MSDSTDQEYEKSFAAMWAKATTRVEMTNTFPTRKEIEEMLNEDNQPAEYMDMPKCKHRKRNERTKYNNPDDLFPYLVLRRSFKKPTIHNNMVFLPYDENFMINMPVFTFKSITNQLNERTRTGIYFAGAKVLVCEEKIEMYDIEYFLHNHRYKNELDPNYILKGLAKPIMQLETIKYSHKSNNTYYCTNCIINGIQ